MKACSYDPPHYVAAQLKTAAQIRAAWHQILIDVEDAKYRQSFLHWLPAFLPRVHKNSKTTQSQPEFIRDLLLKVRGMTMAQRKSWFDRRVQLMLQDEAPMTKEDEKKEDNKKEEKNNT